MFKDLTETLIAIVITLALIGATYHVLSSLLVTTVTTSFDGLR